MTKNLLSTLLLIGIFTFLGSSGCTGNLADNSSEEVFSLEESRQIAENYIRNLDSYRIYNLTEPVLIEAKPLDCTSCYKFDLISEKNTSVIDTARVTITVVDGEVIEAVYAQGSRREL
jgi:hypothetical protein